MTISKVNKVTKRQRNNKKKHVYDSLVKETSQSRMHNTFLLLFWVTSSSSCSSVLPFVCTVTEYQSKTESKRSPFTLFWFCSFFWKFSFSCLFCSPQLGSRRSSSALSRDIRAWEFGGIVVSAMSPFTAHLSLPFAGKSSQPPSAAHSHQPLFAAHPSPLLLWKPT